MSDVAGAQRRLLESIAVFGGDAGGPLERAACQRELAKGVLQAAEIAVRLGEPAMADVYGCLAELVAQVAPDQLEASGVEVVR